MSMAFHFFKRDLRRVWWLYSIWFLVYAAEGIFTAFYPPLQDWALVGNALVTRGLISFSVLHLLVLVVLVAQLVQEDPPVGSTAFWLTRPVSRASLLLSKTAGLGLVLLIPVFVNTAALSKFGFSPGDLALAAAEILAHQCSIVFPIAAIAALTPNFRWYGAATIGLAVGIGVVLFIPANGFNGGFVLDRNAVIALSNTRAFLGESILIASGGLVLAHQYLTRRTRRSIILAACAAGAYILIAGFWPWSFGNVAPIHADHAPFEPSKVALEVRPIQLNRRGFPGGGFAGVVSLGIYIQVPKGFSGEGIDAAFSLSGIPEDLYVQVRSANPKMTMPDGTAIKTFNQIPAGSSSSDSAVAAALGGIPVYSYFLGGSGSANLAVVDTDTFQRYRDGPVRIVDDFDLVAARYQVAAEIPIVKGGQFIFGRVSVRIMDLVPRPDGVTLVVLKSTILLSPDSSTLLGSNPLDPRLRGDPVFLLVNRSRREAVPINPTITRTGVGDSYLSGMLYQQNDQMPFGGGGGANAPVLDKHWLAGATLVCLERVPVFEFRKTAEVDLLKLGEPWLRKVANPPLQTPISGTPASGAPIAPPSTKAADR